MAENVNSKDQDHCSRLLVEVISTIEFSKSPPSNSAPSLETLQKTSEGCSSSSMIPENNIDSDEYSPFSTSILINAGSPSYVVSAVTLLQSKSNAVRDSTTGPQCLFIIVMG